MNINEIQKKDLYWLAGILEGEGCFLYRKGSSDAAIFLSMADGDIVKRVANFWNSKIWILKLDNPRHNKQYKINIVGYKALEWMKKLYPLLGKRRKKRIKEIFNKYNLSVEKKLPDRSIIFYKVSDEEVEIMRKRYKNGESPYEIAKEFPISGSYCSNICRNNRRKILI